MREVSPEPTRLQFADRVLRNVGPPVKIVLSVAIPDDTPVSLRPATIEHGEIEDTAVLEYLFRQGPILIAPFPDCGIDDTDDDPLDCSYDHDICES